MASYSTYRFKDKDPVLDIARTCVEIFATIHNVSFNKALDLLEKQTGVKKSTMNNWFYGATISPRFCTVAAVVYGTGRSLSVNGKAPGSPVGSRPRFRVAASR